MNGENSQSIYSRYQKALIARWLSCLEAVILFLLEWIPTPLGRVLRRIGYPLIFAELGNAAYIRPGVEFVGTAKIKIGDLISLHRGVRIRSLNTNSNVVIANKVSLDRGVDIKSNLGEIKIGNRAYVGPYTCISGGDITIGDNCLIASHCGIYANNHGFDDPLVDIIDQKSTFQGIAIEDNCWLGSGVKVLDGVTIGKGSIVGAGAVVTKNIPPYSVAVGVPAKVISHRQVNSQPPVEKASAGI
ncbi:MAG: DapH/DapD/GlmU-related protein [Xenococcaceae cyanobacterium MO_188.B32]|nr:DapH/DapD/GlmU-related protein [Xenococcaceae cyanobacterium MO_188.B32]